MIIESLTASVVTALCLRLKWRVIVLSKLVFEKSTTVRTLPASKQAENYYLKCDAGMKSYIRRTVNFSAIKCCAF